MGLKVALSSNTSLFFSWIDQLFFFFVSANFSGRGKLDPLCFFYLFNGFFFQVEDILDHPVFAFCLTATKADVVGRLSTRDFSYY